MLDWDDEIDEDGTETISLNELEESEQEEDSYYDENDWENSYDDLDNEAWERQYRQLDDDEIDLDPWELG